MKNYTLVSVFVLTGLLNFISAWRTDTEQLSSSSPNDEKTEKSLAAFQQMLTVLTHQRCMNCHPSDDRPRQSDDRHVHLFDVQRGLDNHGLAVMRCNSCHQSENNLYSGVPGAPKWHLAPKSMGWQGLTNAQLGEALLDKSKNGGRDIDALVEHMTKDSLVAWAWSPGPGRALPPLSKVAFNKYVHEWANNGAVVPK